MASLFALSWLANLACAAPPAIPVQAHEPTLFPYPSKEEMASVMHEPAEPARIGQGIVLVQARAAAAPGRDETQSAAYRIPFDLPGPERLFRLDSEEDLFQRMKQEARERKPEDLVFPDEPVLSKDPYYGRDWPRTKMVVEPHFVCHSRLYFEELNAERYGWEVGVFQPLISSLAFYKDLVLMPMHAFDYPCRTYDSSAGKCLPGDPVPLILYPPDITLTGIMGQASVMAALFAIFP